MPQKDDKLLQDLVENYARTLMKVAIKSGVPYDDAEDIVMESIWAFYRSEHYGKLDDRETKLMMARIVKNKSIDRYRKRRREDEMTCDDDVGDFCDIKAPRNYEPERAVIAEDNYRRIRDIIENLKGTWRETAILYFLKEYTYTELSEALGISEEACRARIKRIRRHLEVELKEFLKPD